MLKVRKLFVFASLLLTLSGCSPTDPTASDTSHVLSTIKSRGYTAILYSRMLDRSPSDGNWAVVCKDQKGNEYIVTLDPSGNFQRVIQLGVDSRLRLEDMEKQAKKNGMDPKNVSVYLDKSGSLYWSIQNHLYYLSGVQES